MATSKDFVDAIVSGDVKTVKKILKELKSRKNNRKFSEDLIALAIKNNQLVIAKLLINHSATVNKNADKSLTASLFYAIRRKNLKIVKSLVNMGADVNRKSRSGITPLMAAAEQSNLKILSFILKQKPNVNDTDNLGNTALHYVFNYVDKIDRSKYSSSYSLEGRHDLDKVLILKKAGAELDAKCSLKNHPHLETILDLAIYTGATSTVSHLLYSSYVGHKQIDFSKIELAAFDENAVDINILTDAENVEMLKQLASNLQLMLALFIINRQEIGICATEGNLQKVNDFLKKVEEENPRFFEFYRKERQSMMEDRQFLEAKKMGLNGITYWEFITKDREDLVKLLNNEDFVSPELVKEIGEDMLTDDRFFFYQELIVENFFYAAGKSKALKKLTEEVSNLFRAVLPYDCCRQIVHSMTNDELKSSLKSHNLIDISDQF